MSDRMRVIDACAGAGGKTLAIAAQMHNKGRIISMVSGIMGNIKCIKHRPGVQRRA